MTPLSHHEILSHVGPFARAGYHVDLARSDRAARVLAFKPVVHPAAAEAPAVGQLTETLQLDLSGPTATLQRTVATDAGLQSTLDARDTDLGTLVQRVLAVPLDIHFRTANGLIIADSYHCPDDPERPLKLRESHARVQGIELALDADTVTGAPLSVTLTRSDQHTLPQLPADLVAVLGRPWKLLREDDDAGRWTFLLYAPTREPKRSKVTQERFARAVLHLDQVLGNAPTAFHAAHQAARWRVWVRRLMPLAICVTVIASLPLINNFFGNSDIKMNPMIFAIPNFLFIGFFFLSRHELPTLELPPFPRPLAPDAWSPAAAALGSETAETLPENHARG